MTTVADTAGADRLAELAQHDLSPEAAARRLPEPSPLFHPPGGTP